MSLKHPVRQSSFSLPVPFLAEGPACEPLVSYVKIVSSLSSHAPDCTPTRTRTSSFSGVSFDVSWIGVFIRLTLTNTHAVTGLLDNQRVTLGTFLQMVDPNRHLSPAQLAFLQECEDEFKTRYTEKDPAYRALMTKEAENPPIIHPWKESNFHNRRGGGGGGHRPWNGGRPNYGNHRRN